MRYYLYKFNDNWADEMDLEGFAILTEDEKDVALASIKRRFKNGGTICFGTNEENEYDTLREVMNTFSFSEISREEYNSIKRLFGSSFGETGPLDSDYEEEEEEVEYCDECGRELESYEENLCEDCEREMEEEEDEEDDYYSKAEAITEFIKNEYGIESTSGPEHAKFIWKPTPKSELTISIPSFEDGEEEEVEISLKINNRENGYEFFKVEDIYENPAKHLESIIKELIIKAQKRQ